MNLKQWISIYETEAIIYKIQKCKEKKTHTQLLFA